MTLWKSLLGAGLAAAIGLGTSASALAHGPGATSTSDPCGWHQGWHMGHMMGQGHMHMMGPGAMGQHMGPGMMGPHHGHGQQMGHGMMGQDMGPGMKSEGMGHGMMGQGIGQGMGPMMGHGRGHGMMRPLPQDLSAEDVKHMMEHRLAWNGNPNVKVGKVEEKDNDTIVAEIVTQDGSLVDRLEVDRHTGQMRRVH